VASIPKWKASEMLADATNTRLLPNRPGANAGGCNSDRAEGKITALNPTVEREIPIPAGDWDF